MQQYFLKIVKKLCPKNLDNLQKQPILVNFNFKILNVGSVFVQNEFISIHNSI